ncbi:aminopeptidase P family protein [Amycolatopsis magusensis]|uniref:Xaa-Pro aminopeptidase n=1 Tax=Amycolatopsis magusensis TaxID=882444 RepID=A0ABS4PY14_9PSEU|nr:aminopeptidase P family protein [Amycolatopsis magusensis]MBP2184327.1 Xaa-Pro aminopeptidase [Amycolatopsis magusensis]
MEPKRDNVIDLTDEAPRWPPAPFTARDHASRMARTIRLAKQAGLDGVLASPGPDLRWLTGYEPPATTERLTLLILSTHQRPMLLVPALERGDAMATAAATGVEVVHWDDERDPCAVAAEYLPPGGVFGVSDSTWASHVLGLQRAMPRNRYRALSACLPLLRAVKDAGELFRLTAAAAAADATYHEIVRMPFAGRREEEIAASLAGLLRQFGHERVDFTIVGSGPHGADPHHEAGDRVIVPGDAVVLDFGGLMRGYGSDTSRTVTVGDPGPEVRRVHEIVRTAQQEAFEAVRPGVPCGHIDRVAREVIGDAGYGDRFIHRTGHGIGVSTHEPPYLVPGAEQPLEPGMCFSIEPGIYLPGRFGVRIEDIVAVTGDGGRRLNNTDHSLHVVE